MLKRVQEVDAGELFQLLQTEMKPRNTVVCEVDLDAEHKPSVKAVEKTNDGTGSRPQVKRPRIIGAKPTTPFMKLS